MRLMRLAAGGALAQREAQWMVAEKVTAIAEAQAAAVAKMIMGGGMVCRDKIRFRCLSAEGAGKPTSPHPTLISSVPDVLRALRQRWYEMTPEGAANSTSFKMEGSGSGGGSYALPHWRPSPFPCSSCRFRSAACSPRAAPGYPPCQG